MDSNVELNSDRIPELVEAFYKKVWADDVIGPKFHHVDFEQHLPKMVNFWRTILFYSGDYSGSPFEKHVPLGLSKEHFDRWLSLFEETVHEHFEGVSADQIIQRAKLIGLTFQSKLATLNPDN